MKRFKEKSEVSFHLVKVWNFMKNKGEKWTTNREISENVKFSERTVRAHTLYLVKAGLIDQVEIFPNHRFRVAKNPEKRNINFFDRLEKACEIFTD